MNKYTGTVGRKGMYEIVSTSYEYSTELNLKSDESRDYPSSLQY